MTIQHLEADSLTPLQFFQQRNTVENLTVQIPRYIQRGVTVVQELHIINQVESLALQDIGQVGRRFGLLRFERNCRHPRRHTDFGRFGRQSCQRNFEAFS